MLENKIYYKITNVDENHNGFKYQDGLNVLKQKFNDNSYDHCVIGGLYFTDVEHIFEFLDYGIYVREIMLPLENPDFKMIKDGKNKYRANMFILGKKYDLDKIETFKMLIEKGANVHAGNEYALRYSIRNGNLEMVKYLIENGADINNKKVLGTIHYVKDRHLEVVKYLIEKEANKEYIYRTIRIIDPWDASTYPI